MLREREELQSCRAAVGTLTPVCHNGLEALELRGPLCKGRKLQRLELGGDCVGHGVVQLRGRWECVCCSSRKQTRYVVAVCGRGMWSWAGRGREQPSLLALAPHSSYGQLFRPASGQAP